MPRLQLLGSLWSAHASPWSSCSQCSLCKSTKNTSINDVKIIHTIHETICMVAYLCTLHARSIMSTCMNSMLTCNLFMKLSIWRTLGLWNKTPCFCKWILCWLYSRLYDYIIKSLLQSKLMILSTNDNKPISVITNILPSLIVDKFVTTRRNDTHPSFLNMDYTRTWEASLP